MKLSELLQDRDRLTNKMSVPVLLSTEAAQRLSDAQAAVDAAERRVRAVKAVEEGRMAQPRTDEAQTDLDAATEALDAARSAAEEHLIDFVVESVGSDAWEALLTDNQPTAEQRERLKEQTGNVPEFNPETFPLAAVAACLVEPEVESLDDVRALKSKVPDVVWHQLFSAVLRVNRGANRVDPSWLGSGTTKSSAPGSEQQ